MIELKKLTKIYGKTIALNNLDLTINDGEIFGLIGHNGAGKSTTIKSIVSVIEPTEGEIWVDGLNLKEHRDEIKRKIGYVSDSPDMFLKLDIMGYWNFLGTVFDIEESVLKERIEELSRIFELKASNTTIEDLSHGMRQKVFVIGALLPNPSLWILDEPMTGLDPQASYELKKMMIKHAEEGNTVLFSTHVLEVAEKLCHRIGILKNGKLIFLGTMNELKDAHPEHSLEEIYLNMIKAFD
ncbi:MAG: ABC transporter ATP-binding protein [Tissierellia bacterium]|nr:ABC transporter ATP-binding protein [Tissierellia bacterium]